MTDNREHAQDDLLDIPTIHDEFGLPVRTLEHLLYAKHAIATVRIGRRVYVRRSDLLAYFAANTRPARTGGRA